MSGTLSILYAMDTKKIPNEILQEAEARHYKRSKEAFRNFMEKKCASSNNVILDNLPSINGLPLSAFLRRMHGFEPLTRHGLIPVHKILEEEVAKLMDTTYVSENGTSTPSVSSQDKLMAIRTLCKLSVDPKDYEKMAEWLVHNAGLLNEAIAASLSSECRDLLQELCVGIAFLARQFRFQLYDKLELVIAALVRAMAIALIPWESYVENFRDAKERHNDLELARGRQFIFHHPRMEYQFHETNHRVLGYIYYTLGDLLFSCPSPKLIHFFECRIFRRKEMTRNLLFIILHVVVINLPEIQSEAEELFNVGRQPSSVSVVPDRSLTPLMSRRGKIYSEAMWNELPANLYADIIRVYNDRNRANKVLINEIMAILRSQAPDKVPLFEEATLKALEMYSGGGRLGETYQIGRSAVSREGEGTAISMGTTGGHRRRKSLVGTEINTGTGIAIGTAERSGEVPSRQRSSRMNPGETDQTDKTTENQSLNTTSSSTSSANYSSESVKKELKISRRTVIVPKIPDLTPSRGHRKG